ncbi:hypothetical protein [Luteimonas salinilitoris]|uniref:Lipoprotein n=1 Tax=Luteimonas salinilitoris TaxID=3237697 RepID=A0ABV4HQV0_9GAMM
MNPTLQYIVSCCVLVFAALLSGCCMHGPTQTPRSRWVPETAQAQAVSADEALLQCAQERTHGSKQACMQARGYRHERYRERVCKQASLF